MDDQNTNLVGYDDHQEVSRRENDGGTDSECGERGGTAAAAAAAGDNYDDNLEVESSLNESGIHCVIHNYMLADRCPSKPTIPMI
jgi:hypothetical protein